MMPEEQKKMNQLILRSLSDVQAQAERILKGEHHRATIETFARFCTELNDYIRRNEHREDVIAALNEIPEVRYEKLRHSFVQYMFAPSWFYSARKKAVIEQVRRAREKYAMLELRIRGMNFDN